MCCFVTSRLTLIPVGNEIAEKGAYALHDMLLVNTTLTKLDLSRASLVVVGVLLTCASGNEFPHEILFDAVERNFTLLSLIGMQYVCMRDRSKSVLRS